MSAEMGRRPPSSSSSSVAKSGSSFARGLRKRRRGIATVAGAFARRVSASERTSSRGRSSSAGRAAIARWACRCHARRRVACSSSPSRRALSEGPLDEVDVYASDGVAVGEAPVLHVDEAGGREGVDVADGADRRRTVLHFLVGRSHDCVRSTGSAGRGRPAIDVGLACFFSRRGRAISRQAGLAVGLFPLI